MSESIGDDAERKQVTVLFADVSGSMDLAEQQDPEEWRKIMQRFFALLADSVTRFEGTVDKFTGDGIMAIFGAPIAHEDHARRACYAALRMLDDVAEYAAELRREQGLNFSTRIGINSGEVVVGAIDGGGEGSYTAIGHTVGLAQRMEALAEPGRAYLTEHTAELARGFLDLRDLGEFEIKGASQPVQVFELEGVGKARSRLDLARERGFSRFVGRERETEALRAALERARSGEACAVGVVAEPGIGKSRLYHEFAQRCRGEGMEVFETQAQAHGTTIPFMPILQMLRTFFAIGDGDSEQQTREKIAGKTLLLDQSFAEDLPLIFDFLGVPDADRPLQQMSPEARQRALASVLCRLVGNPARRKTLVLVFEDLHWIDDGSQTMLDGLLDGFGKTRTLVLVNYRPEYEPPWTDSTAFEALPLEPLARADTRELLRDLAGEDPSLDGLDEPIHERTQGNPFFIEEIVRELAERGHMEGERGSYRLVRPIDDAGVPASVQAVLSARIDRLDPAAKQLLQVASVVGKEMNGQALGLAAGLDEEQIDPTLRDLITAGFLYEAEMYPQRVFAFRHPLTREVAYSSQLADRRAATHVAAARAIVALEPDRHDELAGLVARHMDEGGEKLEAARWYARSAHWAGHSRPQDAARLWQRVTELADELDEDEETLALALASRMLQLEYAWRLGMDRERVEALADEAREIAVGCGDLRSQALLKLLSSAVPGAPGHVQDWVRSVEEAIVLADETGDPGLRAAIRGAATYPFMFGGEIDRMEEIADEMLAILGDDSDLGAGIVIGTPIAWGRMVKSVALRERNQLEEAERLLDEAMAEAAARRDPETESWSLGWKAMMLADRGEIEAGLALGLRNCELTERLGDVFSHTVALTCLGYVRFEAGELEEALADVELAERLYREAMGPAGESAGWRGTLRSLVLLGLGRIDEARREAEASVAGSRERGINWQLPLALRALAQARAAAGEDGVVEALDEAAEIAERLGHRMTLKKIVANRDELVPAG